MPLPTDSDPVLDALQDDLRARIIALNELYHPVYGGDPKRIAELERTVADLRASIAARRAELAGRAPKRAS